ncbi:Pls/PosA family non-ribosomal peptide synthetase [Actinomycetospora corticicola]|uniref:Non-ribosomal peptide synthetase-like protein n=1 Tax=Actinomycetospora corticicola TaxID=663602 RepID=A0A7Y9DTR2_9PSEU|nr:Pls/PosA family non-ribosomal peptide synthetase [Actinomycetospora corticicola]NYD35254.1 non-ribosomal peptide synthetase-like protein [Actinomycetospora corticicola]
MEGFFEAVVDRWPDRVAVEADGEAVRYRDLEARANRLAHLLAARDVGAGDRVAVLLPRSGSTYVAILGVLKAGATLVPIDPGSPADRVAHVVVDAEVALVLTVRALADRVTRAGVIVLDEAGDELAAASAARPAPRPDVGTAYVIFTSGSSGRPKGVAVSHASIANFLAVIPGVYDVRPDDRVHQGMTISFDFSIEEIWSAWAVGATVVAGPDDERAFGADLGEHLAHRRITVLCAVPTLLATVPTELPDLRTVLVGGEACPAEIVERWARPGRRLLNTYGPTEATVTATWCELTPGRPVTIGRPLPTYTAELTDPDHPDHPPVADGEVGEITLGGPGVALGYLGRPELTAERFVLHPDTGERVYRTGDLGRLDADGEIVYLGRADAEVKVRGHRVDLGEIESVLLADEEVGAAVVALDPASGDLAAYVVDPVGRPVTDPDARRHRLHRVATDRLPAYMVPATLDVLTVLPTQASGKVDRSALPAPVGPRFVGAGVTGDAPAPGPESRIADVVAGVLGLESVPATADFFDDLGGHSLLAARTVTALRAAGFGVAVRDLYAHPDVRSLAAALHDRPTTAAPAEPPLRHSDRRVAFAGGVQAVGLYLVLLALTLPASVVYWWNDGVVSPAVLLEILAAGTATYLGVRWVLPVLLVRPLTLFLRPGTYRLWGAVYLRLWAVDLLLRLSPLPVLAGGPFAAPYLRLLGARIGRRVHLAAATVSAPVLLRLGDDASLGYGVSLRPWQVRAGRVEVGAITVGERAAVGTGTLLAPGSRVGADAVVGEQSVLARDGDVPAGATVAGSPPVPAAAADPMLAALGRARPARGWRWYHLPPAVAGVVGLEAAAVLMVVPTVVAVWAALLTWGVLAGLVATLLSGPLFVLTVCGIVAAGRRLLLPRTPVGVHAVRSGLGLRKWLADALLVDSLTFTNSLYATLYTPGWMRLLGARIGPGAEVSTVAHVDPDLLDLGGGSFVADMAGVGSATFARGWMLLRPTEVGERAFVGNAALLPGGTRAESGSLVGVATAPPPVVGRDSAWLGSPAIHLPRREASEEHPDSETFRPSRRRVRRRLAVEFVRASLPASLLGLAVYLHLTVLSSVADGQPLWVPALVAPVMAATASALVIGYVAAVKHHVVGAYRPRTAPLWDEFVRRSEFVTGLYEAAAVPAGLALLTGTPFLPGALRLFGARIGARVWLGTTYLTEFDLVDLGDDATVGREASLQTHLFEDRVMKMSTVRVAPGATVGDRSIVLYDGEVGEGAELGPLSLVMKGEHLAAGSRSRGIPAEAVAA